MARRGDGPAVIEVLRMNINQFERAVEGKDGATAKRCIDAAEMMFRGLRDVASGAGCDVGPPVWRAQDELKNEDGPQAFTALPPPAPTESAGPSTVELELVLRRVLAERQREILPPPPVGWIARLERREWSGLFWRLTWAWVCCAAALVWRGVRRVFRGIRSGR